MIKILIYFLEIASPGRKPGEMPCFTCQIPAPIGAIARHLKTGSPQEAKP